MKLKWVCGVWRATYAEQPDVLVIATTFSRNLPGVVGLLSGRTKEGLPVIFQLE